MFRGLILLIFLSMTVNGQSEETPSESARNFLKAVAKGELGSAEKQIYRLLIADGKVYGSAEAPPVSVALKLLSDSGYEYHKELSVETSKDLSRVYIEVIRRMTDHTAVDLFEVMLLRSGGVWKISGWRNVSTPIDRSRNLTVPNERPFVRPFQIPFVKPCPTCS
jgi:hypothetical protein